MGLTATAFKTRWRNHQMSFKDEKKRYDTELNKYLWELKMKNEEFKVSWKILAKARAYSNLSKRCNLCIEEKYFIITNPQMATLNKRNELVSTCRHRRNYILEYNRLVTEWPIISARMYFLIFFLKFLNQMRFSRDNGQIMARDYVDK